jgi:dephospho-CoA kinase
MLRIGLTGGIGAGKSTVSSTFAQCGGVIVDGDVISREVVQPGTAGLAALVDHFGHEILLPDGALNRPALAAKAFGDEAQRAKLNEIVHPLVASRRAEIVAAVSEDQVIVEDIPLLVESQMAPLFPLVAVVHAEGAQERAPVAVRTAARQYRRDGGRARLRRGGEDRG